MGAYYKVPLLVWLVIWGSCSREMEKQRLEEQRVDALEQKVHGIIKTIDTKTPNPPFEWSRSEKKQFLDRLKNLKQGKQAAEVVKLLGAPYSVNVRGRKESPEPEGIYIDYYLKKIGEGSNEYHDQSIDLVFDNDGKLTDILTNIKGLTVGNLVTVNSGGTTLENLEEPDDR